MKKSQYLSPMVYILIIIILILFSLSVHDTKLINHNKEKAIDLCETMGFNFWEINNDKYECIDSSNSIRGFRR